MTISDLRIKPYVHELQLTIDDNPLKVTAPGSMRLGDILDYLAEFGRIAGEG